MNKDIIYKAVCLDCGWSEESDDVTESNYGEVSYAFMQGDYHKSGTGHMLMYCKGRYNGI